MGRLSFLISLFLSKNGAFRNFFKILSFSSQNTGFTLYPAYSYPFTISENLEMEAAGRSLRSVRRRLRPAIGNQGRAAMRRLLFFLPVLSVSILLWSVLPSGEVGGSEGIVGAEICKGCHEDHYQSYLKSTHAKKGIPGSPAGKDACETCHGPGAAHVEKSGEKGVGIFIFSKKIADAKSKCTRGL